MQENNKQVSTNPSIAPKTVPGQEAFLKQGTGPNQKRPSNSRPFNQNRNLAPNNLKIKNENELV